MSKAIMVLADGETYSEIDECSICILSDEVFLALVTGEVHISDIPVMSEIAFEVK